MKKIIIAIVVIILIALGIYLFTRSSSDSVDLTKDQGTMTEQNATSTNEVIDDSKVQGKTVIGKSVEERDINAYHYGTGDTELLFVGGIHGGYEWNTALVAYETIDYLEENLEVIPENIRVTVIPVLNPDGLNKTVGTAERFSASDVPSSQAQVIAGRFNANKVDLNRNFDCDWQETGTWQNTPVSGGTAAFSEPESQAIKNYVETYNPKAVVVWYSSANGVFASSCHNDVSEETQTLTNTFAKASGYPAYEEFDFYAITGDMVNWLAKKNIPAISVLLSNHTDTKWSKNKKGIDAVLKYYAN